MKFLVKAGFVTLFAVCMFHGNASAESTLEAKCGAVTPNENPPFQQVNCLLTNAAIEANIPPEVVKGVASQENGWRQFDGNGEPVISDDGGIGLMQVTNHPEYDQEKLKSDIIYNIEAGVKILSNMYAQDLPKIKDAGRQDIENWYFPVMAYNGIKPVNSPLYQSSGLRNMGAYQEKVFANIENDSFLGDTELAQFPFKQTDFQYDSNSDANINFLTKEYTLSKSLHNSAYFYKKGDKVVVTKDNVNVRMQPSTNAKGVKALAKNTTLIIDGNFAYEQTPNSKNQFVWYPVKTEDQKVVGYIASPYVAKPDICAQYHKGQKIYWDGLELRYGQIGLLTVLKDTDLFKLNGTQKVFARTLKKGGVYRIYAFKPGMLNVGGGYYVDRDEKVKYQTPSKAKLIAVKCIAGL